MQLDATYRVEDEQKARRWMEAITGEPVGEEFFEFLHDGSYLCRLVARARLMSHEQVSIYHRLLNTLESGTVPAKYGKPAKQPFNQVRFTWLWSPP